MFTVRRGTASFCGDAVIQTFISTLSGEVLPLSVEVLSSGAWPKMAIDTQARMSSRLQF